LAARLVGRFMQNPQGPAHHSPAVTILKPLHQGEPELSRNLETFFAQNYDGAVQILSACMMSAIPRLKWCGRCKPNIPKATPPL
jgi:hypothetical protein